MDKLASSKNWESNPLFKKLHTEKFLPGIYYFSTTGVCGLDLHNSFLNCKQEASKVRINKGVKDPEYFSISHVPKGYRETSCIYAGSVKKDLFGRLIGHLGFGAKRTGALFLKHVLARLDRKTDIYFNYCLIEEKFRSVTEHIERIFQDHLNPLIGQKAFKSSVVFV